MKVEQVVVAIVHLLAAHRLQAAIVVIHLQQEQLRRHRVINHLDRLLVHRTAQVHVLIVVVVVIVVAHLQVQVVVREQPLQRWEQWQH